MAGDPGLETVAGEKETPAEDSGEAPERDDTFFIPSDMIPGADSLKPGTELKFKLVGRDKDGHLEVEYASAPKADESMEDEMRRTVDEPAPDMATKGY